MAAGGTDSGLFPENIARSEGRGVCSSPTELAEAEKISNSYVSRILPLALPAPDIVEAILGGWADQRVMPERLERPLPTRWEEKTRCFMAAGLVSGSRSLARRRRRIGAGEERIG